jgi:hypothetical protein
MFIFSPTSIKNYLCVWYLKFNKFYYITVFILFAFVPRIAVTIYEIRV